MELLKGCEKNYWEYKVLLSELQLSGMKWTAIVELLQEAFNQIKFEELGKDDHTTLWRTIQVLTRLENDPW